MGKGKKVQLKIIKRHNKRRFCGKRNFYVGLSFYKYLLYIFMFLNKKRKRMFLKVLRKYTFFFKRRALYRNKLLIIFSKNSFNLYKKFFFCFTFGCLLSLSYYNITDYQIELMRRLAKKCFGKKSILNMCIQANTILVKRTNQIRMGGGKGNKFFKRVYFLYPGCLFIIIYGVTVGKLIGFYRKLCKKFSFSFKYCYFSRI
jgi:ribosomal protein L16/L10AE